MMARQKAAQRVVLLGNPNTGKTSLFNALTGLRQRVGNYPGVTVEKKVGSWTLDPRQNIEVQLIDLPGTYSLSAHSPDERVAVDVLAGRMEGQQPPDLVIVVVDVEHLQRNLFVASQAAEMEVPMVIALNCWDVAEKKGLQIDCKLLEQRLGVPVIPTVATKRRGTDELASAALDALQRRPLMTRPNWPEAVRAALRYLHEELITARSEHLNPGELQRLLFDRNSAVQAHLKTPTSEYAPIIRHARDQLFKAGFNPDAAESILRYRGLTPLLGDIIARQAALKQRSITERIDQVLLDRVWGLAVFTGMMYLVFQAVYSWAMPFVDALEAGVGLAQSHASDWLAGMPVLQSLIAEGIIGGVGAFVVFLPQIMVLFFFIALLEESGYMARAAFLMDKLFHWCGLSGKSFVPLLSSYACAIPGILAARTISDPKARMITILIAPLMSCSARLPVYLLLIGAFVEPRYGPAVAGATLFALHFVGATAAIPLAWTLNRVLNKGKRPAPFLLELPPYRSPRLKSMFWRIFESGKDFVIRAGTIIFAMTVVLWALLYFPRSPEVEATLQAEFLAQVGSDAGGHTTEATLLLGAERDQLESRIAARHLENSYLGRFGKFVQPIFAPAGYDWKITVGVLASFPAREVIISTLGVIYSLGGEVDPESGDLREALAQATWDDGPRAGQPVFTLPVTLSILVFFALCLQCGATLAVIAKELNWRWAIGSFILLTALAWVAAVLTYQAGRLFLG